MKTKISRKIFAFLGGVVDIVWISILWYLSSIPIITSGASSSAMYYTVHTNVFQNRGYLFSVYKKAFFDNFKKATVIWVAFFLLDAFLFFDLMLAKMAIDQGSSLAALYYPVLICIILALMWQISTFTYQARFDDTIKNIFIKGGFIAMRNIGWMLFLVIFLTGLLLLCRYLIFLIVVLPGGYTCMVHHVFEHIYKKVGWIEEEETI
ncbi:MAG: DUF624 domain-containing protein [Lachnospiraceae bacterium]|nr:DUF624 domain-containing protein [Lachnospiraceae bacterium]